MTCLQADLLYLTFPKLSFFHYLVTHSIERSSTPCKYFLTFAILYSLSFVQNEQINDIFCILQPLKQPLFKKLIQKALHHEACWTCVISRCPVNCTYNLQEIPGSC